HPLALEHPGRAAWVAQGSAEPGERVPDLLPGAVPVVGHGLDQDRHAAGRVALVRDLLVLRALDLAGAPLDRPLDVVARNRALPGLLDRGGEGHVAVDASAALPSRDLDGAKEPGEVGRPARVGGLLLLLEGA